MLDGSNPNPYSGKVIPFPFPDEALAAFEKLWSDLLNACLSRIDEREPSIVEYGASDYAIAATLNQNGCSAVAFTVCLQH